MPWTYTVTLSTFFWNSGFIPIFGVPLGGWRCKVATQEKRMASRWHGAQTVRVNLSHARFVLCDPGALIIAPAPGRNSVIDCPIADKRSLSSPVQHGGIASCLTASDFSFLAFHARMYFWYEWYNPSRFHSELFTWTFWTPTRHYAITDAFQIRLRYFIHRPQRSLENLLYKCWHCKGLLPLSRYPEEGDRAAPQLVSLRWSKNASFCNMAPSA